MLVAFNSAFAVDLYVSPTGNDANSGKGLNLPFKSLKKALMTAYGGQLDDAKSVTIHVGPGVYERDSIRIKVSRTVPDVTISGPANRRQQAVFNNGPKNQSWIALEADLGQALNLTIKNIEVRNYFSAISILGNRDDPGKGSSGIILQNNTFRSIGSTSKTSTGPVSTGVIRLINSSKNLIENNSFVDIYNSKGCDALHSIYLAHFSSDNIIRNNRFNKACGASIRLRDRANNNKITNNRFENLDDVSAVQEWFCDKAGRSGCTKEKGECPSVNNIVDGNVFSPNRKASQYITALGDRKARSWCNDSLFTQKRFR